MSECFAKSQKFVMALKMMPSEAVTMGPEVYIRHAMTCHTLICEGCAACRALYECRERADAAESQKKTVTGLTDTLRHAEDALNANFDKCTSLVSSLPCRGSPTPARLCCTAPLAPV